MIIAAAWGGGLVDCSTGDVLVAGAHGGQRVTKLHAGADRLMFCVLMTSDCRGILSCLFYRLCSCYCYVLASASISPLPSFSRVPISVFLTSGADGTVRRWGFTVDGAVVGMSVDLNVAGDVWRTMCGTSYNLLTPVVYCSHHSSSVPYFSAQRGPQGHSLGVWLVRKRFFGS
jgi:hypothetical protein